jgi:hypothetical protein
LDFRSTVTDFWSLRSHHVVIIIITGRNCLGLRRPTLIPKKRCLELLRKLDVNQPEAVIFVV